MTKKTLRHLGFGEESALTCLVEKETKVVVNAVPVGEYFHFTLNSKEVNEEVQRQFDKYADVYKIEGADAFVILCCHVDNHSSTSYDSHFQDSSTHSWTNYTYYVQCLKILEEK